MLAHRRAPFVELPHPTRGRLPACQADGQAATPPGPQTGTRRMSESTHNRSRCPPALDAQLDHSWCSLTWALLCSPTDEYDRFFVASPYDYVSSIVDVVMPLSATSALC